MTGSRRVAVVGGGVGGLAAATRLSAAGHDVTVFERNEVVGGKLASFTRDGYTFDIGPSLITLPHVFDELFSVVDTSPELIQAIRDTLDVRGLVGHGAHPDVLAQAGIDQADMIIAVTLYDEVNMVACQVAASLFNVPTKIARIRAQSYLAPEYSDLFPRETRPIPVPLPLLFHSTFCYCLLFGVFWTCGYCSSPCSSPCCPSGSPVFSYSLASPYP